MIKNLTKNTIIAQNEFEIADIRVNRFATSHDASDSSGYTFCLSTGEKIGICTDLGIVTDEVRSALYGCNTLLFESNHDVEMLRRGPYPVRRPASASRGRGMPPPAAPRREGTHP